MAIDWSDDEPLPVQDFTPSKAVPLRTMDDACKLLDDWTEAYDRDVRAYARALHARDDQLWHAETDAFLWRSQAELYRAQLVAADVAPMDALEPPSGSGQNDKA